MDFSFLNLRIRLMKCQTIEDMTELDIWFTNHPEIELTAEEGVVFGLDCKRKWLELTSSNPF